MKKVLLAALAVVLVGALGVAGFVGLMRPRVRAASAQKVEATPEKLARGRYLAENVTGCFHCHSQADKSVFGTPPKPGTLGGGGMCLGPEQGFPGTMCASNITPDPDTGIGRWTDGEIIRAIREGVDREGRALMPIMPYSLYRELSDEDVEAVVAYVRTIPAIRNTVAEPRLEFPMSVVVRFLPAPVEQPVVAPARSDTVAYGKYLVTVGGCVECHTPRDERHEPLPGKWLAGAQREPHPACDGTRGAQPRRLHRALQAPRAARGPASGGAALQHGDGLALLRGDDGGGRGGHLRLPPDGAAGGQLHHLLVGPAGGGSGASVSPPR
jgi:mono/diheme cytochrome c family protein